MAISTSGDAPTSRNTILSRDLQGNEHYLRVVDHHPHGLVSISDDEFRRALAPPAAVELALRLLLATKAIRPAAVSDRPILRVVDGGDAA